MISVTDPYGRILGFLDLSRYIFFQVVPDHYFSENLVGSGNEPGPLDL
jgi:hypothetical protein